MLEALLMQKVIPTHYGTREMGILDCEVFYKKTLK